MSFLLEMGEKAQRIRQHKLFGTNRKGYRTNSPNQGFKSIGMVQALSLGSILVKEVMNTNLVVRFENFVGQYGNFVGRKAILVGQYEFLVKNGKRS